MDRQSRRYARILTAIDITGRTRRKHAAAALRSAQRAEHRELARRYRDSWETQLAAGQGCHRGRIDTLREERWQRLRIVRAAVTAKPSARRMPSAKRARPNAAHRAGPDDGQGSRALSGNGACPDGSGRKVPSRAVATRPALNNEFSVDKGS